jgi:hypothetical protein
MLGKTLDLSGCVLEKELKGLRSELMMRTVWIIIGVRRSRMKRLSIMQEMEITFWSLSSAIFACSARFDLEKYLT